MSNRILFLVSLLMGAACLGASAEGHQPRYDVVDLGLIQTFSGDIKPGLGPAGDVVLWRRSTSGSFVPLHWKDAAVEAFPVPEGYRNAFAYSLNSAGHASGWANNTANPVDSFATTHAILFTKGQARDLGVLSGGKNSSAYAINENDDVAGISDTPGGRLGFRWSHGSMQPLLPLATGNNTAAYGLNRRGHIAGASDVRDFRSHRLTTHAVIWTNSRPQDLGASYGLDSSVAYDLNSSDEAVGRSTQNNENSAFLYSHGTITRLGVEGSAFSINDKRDIVGVIDAPERGLSRGFLWRLGKVYDLSHLLATPEGIHIEVAFSINLSGEILCLGQYREQTHLMLLVPQKSAN